MTWNRDRKPISLLFAGTAKLEVRIDVHIAVTIGHIVVGGVDMHPRCPCGFLD